MVRRRFPHVFVLAMAVLALAACGGSTPGLLAESTGNGTPIASTGDEGDGAAPERTPPVRAPATSGDSDEAGPRNPIVVLDPGHGGDEIGAAAHGITEKDSNLDMAFRIETLLLEAGVDVVLTRRNDERVAETGATGFARSRIDRQARVDLANDAGADVFVSVHSNGIGDTSVRGLETYHNSQRSFASENAALARSVHDAVLREAAAAGHPLVDRGIRDDSCLFMHRGNCWPIFVLGPAREAGTLPPGSAFAGTRATQMPGVLVELLFITNAADAALLQDDAVRDAMALGVAEGILEFLMDGGLLPDGAH